MRIGIDASCWANHRGYGRFTRELCSAMVARATRDEFIFFLDPKAGACFELQADNAKAIHVEQKRAPTEAASAKGSRSVPDMLRLSRAVKRAGPDVFFSPSVYTYFPLPRRLPAVVTIHDAIVERLPALTLPTMRARLFWAAKVKLAIHQARIILTVSDYSAKELNEVHRIAQRRIRVAVPAPSPAYSPGTPAADIRRAAARIGLPDGARWFIYVGGFNPHKNVRTLVRAHAELGRGLPNPPHLLLVGKVTGDAFFNETSDVRDVVTAEGMTHLVHWTGFLPDAELRSLHSGALALVLPSELEGLGLPALEAAACGTPVIATTRSPLPALLQGGGLFVDPGDATALSTAMRRLLTDDALREDAGRCALRRSRAITWDSAADVTLDALRDAQTAGRP